MDKFKLEIKSFEYYLRIVESTATEVNEIPELYDALKYTIDLNFKYFKREFKEFKDHTINYLSKDWNFKQYNIYSVLRYMLSKHLGVNETDVDMDKYIPEFQSFINKLNAEIIDDYTNRINKAKEENDLSSADLYTSNLNIYKKRMGLNEGIDGMLNTFGGVIPTEDKWQTIQSDKYSNVVNTAIPFGDKLFIASDVEFFKSNIGKKVRFNYDSSELYPVMVQPKLMADYSTNEAREDINKLSDTIKKSYLRSIAFQFFPHKKLRTIFVGENEKPYTFADVIKSDNTDTHLISYDFDRNKWYKELMAEYKEKGIPTIGITNKITVVDYIIEYFATEGHPGYKFTVSDASYLMGQISEYDATYGDLKRNKKREDDHEAEIKAKKDKVASKDASIKDKETKAKIDALNKEIKQYKDVNLNTCDKALFDKIVKLYWNLHNMTITHDDDYIPYEEFASEFKYDRKQANNN